jgi:hypothetical protein
LALGAGVEQIQKKYTNKEDVFDRKRLAHDYKQRVYDAYGVGDWTGKILSNRSEGKGLDR